ncbi:cohesin complex subunit [Didymosphaeria variabile]|uniref:Cohesin complex subunit n=1 Tax=Didymosphaeria variabile TaxID=1932322 RepID=A0A9W8XQV7_9PLEO|nr:cohesin complex subunit [Didymosphaeria variabile]KAJ4356582.1 cohesin complex subunit [Didymosphaeria variabile]
MSTDVASSSVADITSSAPRRKSGRVPTQRQLYSPTGSAKRKRGDGNDSDVDNNAPSSEEEDSESSADEEELKERRKQSRKKRSATAAKKPPQKKPKTNGEITGLAIRPATNTRKKAPRSRKAPIRKSALVDQDADGLYAEIFARGTRLNDVAAQWIGRFHEHEAKAVAEIVNLVVRAAGCHVQIDEDDIAEPDNCPHRLGELQDEYNAEQVTDYPLISKTKGAAAFRNALHDFFIALTQTIAQTGLMYEENQLMENIQVWVCTMTSATNRPFRHTSTVAALGVTSGLTRIASDIAESTAKMMRQKETESKKSRANKSRLATIDQEVEELNQKLEHVKALITDWFDTVYVHRYRDVDPKVRVECCEALADWIMTYPDKFFDGQHLRYLGWILSDTNEGTRAEVLKQLSKLYHDKDKLAGLKTFTERFRARIVEIATRDAHTNIRASAVELLDILREAGFLEPDDIDTVGKLIFDSEPKVRKAVVGFFAENVNAAYELQIEDMGGQEALDEALTEPDDEEYRNARLEWLKMKCLVEQLLSYDEDTGLPSQIERVTPYGAELGLVAAGIESRFSLAAQALYDAIPEVSSWEVLAGYLLYDHSQTSTDVAGDDAESMLRRNCKLEEHEETALLDILNASVRIRLQRLAETQKDKKRTKTQRTQDQIEQEDTAKKLTTVIPQLLKKFGALPEAASLCLRLERELNLDVFQELRQNTALTALLDDINKQFLTHNSERVLGEAISSILHALSNDELRELVDSKTQSLWDDLSGTFDALRRGRDLSIRGGIEQNILAGISNIVLKMSELAKASEPAVLDQIPAPTKARTKNKKPAALDTPPMSALLEMLDRGVPADDLEPEVDEAEDALVRHTMSLMLPYFLWKCRNFSTRIEAGTRIPDDELTVVAERRDICITALMRIIESRKAADELRVEAADLLLDLYNLFRALKAMQAKASKGAKKPNGRASDASDDWEALCQEIDGKTVRLLLHILTALEQNLAKRLQKRLEGPDVDDDPIDDDDEPESSDDEGDDEQKQSQKQIRALLAEERLCTFGSRIVHGVQVGSLDADDEKTVRTRLERNKSKLTPSWKEVVSHLDVNKHIKGKGVKKAQPAKESAKAAKSRAIVVDDVSEDEEVQDDPIEDDEMPDADAGAGAEVEEQVNGDAESANGDVERESVLGD